MPPATNEEQFRFLISCIRWSNNGRVDFQEVANECHVVSKGAAAKRYERMMRAHGIHPNGGPAVPTESGRSPGIPRVRQPKAARYGGDRYGKGKKTDKQKAKQAQFDEERDMDMDDEEDSSFHQSSNVKGEQVDDGDDGVPALAVKAEQNEDAYETDEYASLSPAQARFASLAVAQNDGGNSPRPLAQALHNSSISSVFEAANAADAAYLAKWTPQPGFGGGLPYDNGTATNSSSAYGMSTQSLGGTLPQNGFDFNNFTPRQHTPTSFFPGTREPEEVIAAEPIASMSGSGSPRPHREEGEEVIQLD